MHKKLLFPLLIALLAFALGAFLAFRQAKSNGLGSPQHVLQKGSWMLPPKLDLSGNMWARAKIALTALFALRESEVFYALAQQDNEGNALDGKHTYRVRGKALDTRYWSITLYGEDFFLIPNTENRFTVNMYDVTYDDEGNFSFIISPKKHADNWLPTDDTQKFDLLLRLYNPSKATLENLETVSLPIIEKLEE